MVDREPGAMGRAYLGLNEPPFGAEMSPESRMVVARRLRITMYVIGVVAVIAPIVVALITRSAEATGAGAFAGLFVSAESAWIFRSHLRDLRSLDQE